MGYVVAGWIIGIGGFALYAGYLLRRGRRLASHVPADRRRWMTADE
ncbi:MAG: hypothetical protein OEW42_12580 [Acidimicrobiia bacterium]|nr:hypothetical protein [Acidimicrobiia bacterium]MDH5238101.1 hypothetical protein [Acidimicrobiia bacterium]